MRPEKNGAKVKIGDGDILIGVGTKIAVNPTDLSVNDPVVITFNAMHSAIFIFFKFGRVYGRCMPTQVL